jgi:endo-1,3(4)-beta-glucanase
MGHHHSHPKPIGTKSGTWRPTALASFSPVSFNPTAPPTAAFSVPTDNIFVPIQKDDILSQIPIGQHHPVPRKGIEDDDLRTLHTNKFYANAFLGEQNQPVWTHPYSIWWGKGKDMGAESLVTWGMCVGHNEVEDMIVGAGENGAPAKVLHTQPYTFKKRCDLSD